MKIAGCIRNELTIIEVDMATQKFMGKNQLVDRLAAQVGDKEFAIRLLQKNKQLRKDGKTLTTKGKKRDDMTAKERALDRASKRSNRPTEEYAYNPRTNRATLKK
jgi:hypothetical protein